MLKGSLVVAHPKPSHRYLRGWVSESEGLASFGGEHVSVAGCLLSKSGRHRSSTYTAGSWLVVSRVVNRAPQALATFAMAPLTPLVSTHEALSRGAWWRRAP